MANVPFIARLITWSIVLAPIAFMKHGEYNGPSRWDIAQWIGGATVAALVIVPIDRLTRAIVGKLWPESNSN